jgi:hypothetical protein
MWCRLYNCGGNGSSEEGMGIGNISSNTSVFFANLMRVALYSIRYHEPGFTYHDSLLNVRKHRKARFQAVLQIHNFHPEQEVV